MASGQLVVMAAGIGSRYGGLKQIDPVGPSGEIIIDYALYDAIEAGFQKVIFVINKDIEQAFRAKIGNAVERKVEVAYAFQELNALPPGFDVPPGREKPWGTAHAVLCASSKVDGPFAAINADDYYGRDAFQKLSEYLDLADDTSEAYDYCMVGYVLNNTLTEHGHVARGVCTVSAEGYLETVVERTKIRKFGDLVKYTEDDENWVEIDPASTVSMNMWGFTQSFMDELEARFPEFLRKNTANLKAEYFVPTAVNDLVSRGKATVKVLPTDERWFGVTYRQDKDKVVEAISQKIAEGVYPRRLWD